MSRSLAIPEPLRLRQVRASDPKTSAWVSANAGSGKTHVLTQRVLRLLLDGTPPAQILCLAYTKAAAANMADRVFTTLARWTSLDDAALARAIVDCGAAKPDPPKLVFARQLFARTIETPGGLKIQTIHAFAEKLLRLFPFEANVPAHFKVLDETESRRLLIEARDHALAELGASDETAGLVALVARESGAARFDELLMEALSRAEVFAAHEDATAYAAALRGPLGLARGVTVASVEAEMLGGDVGRMRRERWAQALDGGSKRDRELAASLGEANREGPSEVRVQALLEAFFSDGGGGGPSRLVTNGLSARHPGLEDTLSREQQRLDALREPRRAALTLERSAALFVVVRSILATFARMKAERGALDFSDQIAGALSLVTRSSAAWVMHKLDYGLDHLLLDEAQDASRPQWGILEALSAEFFAGSGARETNRTVFAVGDEKQSIFAFQGAAPEMFAEMKRAFAERHRASKRPFADVPLTFSFRSSQTVLDAVDMTFRNEFAWRGVAAPGEPPPKHDAVRSQLKGVVELWPPIAPTPAPDPDDWSAPLEPMGLDAPPVILARRIAEVIKGWLKDASRERVIDAETGEARRIRESDVMILVRTRNAFFEAMIRALKTADIKAAGADRLKLKDHIAVMDLIAAARAAMMPDDDLTLASVLKSPLIGCDDDALMRIAAGRKGSLAEALMAADKGLALEARRRLGLWRGRAKALSPFAFYARLLGQDGGRRALIGRLGPEAADPIDEFLTLALAHEQREAPSLTAFLAEVESADTEIKRDMEAGTDGVRVMTVHASKGLEAPIVFLPDTCTGPDPRHEPKLAPLSPRPGDPPLFAWARRAADNADAVEAARDEARAALAGEHRRLLYVAMTRAAQRLIVAGYETSRSRPADCWWDLIHAGLEGRFAEAPAPFRGDGRILSFGQGVRADDARDWPSAYGAGALPGWLAAEAPREAAPSPLNPSRAGGIGRGDPERALEGRLAHALLETLPTLPPERRPRAATAYLDAWGRALAGPARLGLASKVLAAIDAPELGHLFGPDSRAEVALAGRLARPGRPDLPYSGRLDRLAATGEGVSIADFKLGRKPERPAAAHVAQLALYRAALQPLYRGLPIEASLVYLDGPTLAPVGEAELDEALNAVIETS